MDKAGLEIGDIERKDIIILKNDGLQIRISENTIYDLINTDLNSMHDHIRSLLEKDFVISFMSMVFDSRFPKISVLIEEFKNAVSRHNENVIINLIANHRTKSEQELNELLDLAKELGIEVEEKKTAYYEGLKGETN